MSKKNSVKDKAAAKKAVVLEDKPKTGTYITSALIFGALIIFLLVFFLDFGGKDTTAKPEATTISQAETVVIPQDSTDASERVSSTKTPSYEASADKVTYAVSTFDEGTAKYYEYPGSDGTTIRYFILKSTDGVIRAAFDACDVCWQAGLGYEQSGNVMVCRNCGRQFESTRINEVKGGCNPAPLTRTIDGDKLIIEVKDILAGKQYFNLGRG